jgi:peptidoglycan hydrolase-like protein with peptidoglycan-binding domain
LRFLTLVALTSVLGFAGSANTTTPKKKRHVTKQSAARSRSSVKKSTSTKAAVKRRKAPRKKVQSWRTRQMAPTPDRYRQIQQALVARGYLDQKPTGVWDNESTEALRRFQKDQNLDPSGKVNSLSLIALGLGAKHATIPPADAPGAGPAPPNTAEPPPTPAPPNAAPADPNGR